MSESPGSLSRIWSELKRRKVIKAAAMYAATAYIIIEASDIILPRLGLPDWTVTFLIIFLIIGFPITLILSWIFDVTPEGVQKTESVDESATQAQSSDKKRRKLRASDLLIAVLFVMVSILAYPRLFQRNQLDDIRDEKGIISVAVMPFENLTGDSLFNTWQGGLQNLMISELSNSAELQVRQYMTMSTILGQKKPANQASLSPALAREVALNLETRTFIQGKIMKAGEKVRINAQLINSDTEEIYKTYQVDGSAESEFFSLADSLAGLIRNFLEIKKLVEGFNSPQISQRAITQSAEAFQYYIRSYDTFEKLDFPSTIGWLMKAIETDPDFIDAYIFLSFTYVASFQSQPSEEWCNRAYEKRDQAPLRGQLYLDHLHAYLYETPYEEIHYCKQLLEIDEMNTTYWFLLGDAYNKLEQYKEAVSSFEKVLEINEKWGTRMRIPHLYYWMGDALQALGDYKGAKKIYDLGSSTHPGDALMWRYQLVNSLLSGDMNHAKLCIDRFRSIAASDGWDEPRILGGISGGYYFAKKYETAEDYARRALELNPEDPFRMYGLARALIRSETDLEKGMELVAAAIESNPDYYGYYYVRGLGLYKQGRYEEAKEALQKAWDIRGPYDPELLEHIQAVDEALEHKSVN
jgi:tetratricopeptide (TPR) repeat protein